MLSAFPCLRLADRALPSHIFFAAGFGWNINNFPCCNNKQPCPCFYFPSPFLPEGRKVPGRIKQVQPYSIAPGRA